MLTAPIGRHISTLISETALLASFLAYRMWLHAEDDSNKNSVTTRSSTRVDHHNAMRISVTGVICGLLSGFFGVGGGFIIVPILSLYTGLKTHQAIAVSAKRPF